MAQLMVKQAIINHYIGIHKIDRRPHSDSHWCFSCWCELLADDKKSQQGIVAVVLGGNLGSTLELSMDKGHARGNVLAVYLISMGYLIYMRISLDLCTVHIQLISIAL